METKEETEAREKKLVDDTKKFAQGALRKVGINITNPLAGLDVLGEPEYDEVNRRENWAGPEIENISKDVLSQIALQKIPQKSLVPKLPPRSDGGRLINVTPKRGSEIIDQANNLSRFKATTSDQKISEYEAAKLAARFMSARKTAGAENITLKGKSVEPTINWNNYGYTPGTEPTQVKKITIPELKTQVATSLDAFYKKTQGIVQSRTGSRASSRQIKQALTNQPQYWANPVTQKIYRAAWKGGLSKRYTLKPINRQYLEKQQSTAIQKQIQTQYQKDLQRKNIDLKKTWTDNTQPRWYNEHNVYLQSEKVRNYILDDSGVRINDSKEFQLGNIANQTQRLEDLKNPDTLVFRTLKNNLERVLDAAPDEYFSYPNYIVNSNPRLSGGREGIIRIEYSPMEWQSVPGTDRMRPVLTDFKVKGGILSGKSVVEIDTKDLDFIRRELNTPEDIQNWLSREHGINPVSQDQSFPKESFEIRLSKSPLVSRSEQIKEFQKLVEDVQEGRKTWADVFAEEGIEIVPQTDAAKIKKSQGGRPKGSPNKVKGKKGESFLDLLKNTFYDRTE